MKKNVVLAAIMLTLSLFLIAPRPIDFCDRHPNNPNCVTATASPSPTATPTATPSPTPTPTPTPSPLGSIPKLLFGQGAEADAVVRNRIYAEAPIAMLTSWFNGHGDIGWMTGWEDDVVPQAYARGEALHLIVYDPSAEVSLTTSAGPACGRAYPFSANFLPDMEALAYTFRPRNSGDRLYITLFTEFQTYPCTDNQWAGQENYYTALKDRYLAAVAIFHAVGGKVSLGWGGWQTRWDNPTIGAGRSLFPYFADVMNASDFQAFQAMQNDGNVNDVRAMVNTLNAYGTGQVMLAHYKPDNGSQATFDADTIAMFTDAYMAEMKAAGLFAFSFMDNVNLAASETSYQRVKNAVLRYGTTQP